MKTAVKQCAIVLGAILSGAGASVLAEYLTAAWIRLGWDEPVCIWLSAKVSEAVAGYVALLSLHLPESIIAIALGVVCGLVLPGRWLTASTLASAGFLFGLPLVMSLSRGTSPLVWLPIPFLDGVLVFLWLLPVPLSLIGAYGASRLRLIWPQLGSGPVATLIPEAEREKLTG